METSAVAAATLQVRLLGDLELRQGGTSLALPPSRRTRALLGYLIGTGGTHGRAALCDLLWDGPDDPRASLRWSLTKLRPLVDDGPLIRLRADRERVAFDATACEIDAQRVLALLGGGVAHASLESLEEAARLLRGEFLEGLDLPSCFRFHHWCMAERERFGTLRRRVLEALLDRLAGDPARALPYAHAYVTAEPLAEASHALLVRLLAASDRYPDAEAHYGWARELLRREIALPDGGALDSAIRAARRLQQHPEVRPACAAAEAPVRDAAAAPVLLGRSAECAAVEAHLAAPPERALLLVEGEPGIGKTSLLDHLGRRALAAGRRVVRGRCFEAEAVRPYGPWLDALRQLPHEAAGGLVALLGGAAAGAGSREDLFDAVAAAVHAIASESPLTLLFDDVQWIDDASAALVHFVVRHRAGASLLCAAAVRAAEVDDNPSAQALLRSLAREQALHRIALGPLDAESARALLGTVPDAEDALRQAGGNPLFLIEWARAAGRGAGTGGSSFDALVEDRLRALDGPTRELLACAAAFGGPLRAERLGVAAGLGSGELLARLATLERRGLLVPAGDGELDFSHGLVRQVVYRALSQPRRRALHRQIAAALDEAAALDPQLHGEIVHHASLAGDRIGAARACLAAGGHCLRIYANREASQVAERGLAQVAELPGGAERLRLEIGLLRLRIAAAAGPGGWPLPDVSERVEQAVERAEALGLHAEAAAGWEILAFWRQQASDPGRTRQATLAAERSTRQADAVTRCHQLANSGRCLLDIEADADEGRALLEQAEALAETLGLKVMEIDWGRGLAARDAGDLEDAAQALARAVAQARAADNHWREVECLVWLATVEFERGRHEALERHVDEIVAAAARMGEPQAPFALALRALARARAGDAAARVELEAQLDALRERDDKAHLAYALNEAAELAWRSADAAGAAACAREALAVAQAVRRHSEVVVALAWLASAAPDARAAEQWLAQVPVAVHRSARAEGALAAARHRRSTFPSTAAA